MNSYYKNNIALARADKIIKKYLVYDVGILEEDYDNLTENYKENLGGQIVASILNEIKDKMLEGNELKSAYLLEIYKSKGDIKRLAFLDELQEAIFKLEKIIDDYNIGAIKKPISIIIKTLVGINKYSSVFIDAFRNKKTLLILQYVGLIRSLITSIVYILSKTCDVSSTGEIIPKSNIVLDNIMPLKALEEFVNIVEYNNLSKIAQDISVLREGFVEYTADQLYFINESKDIMNMVIDGINNIYDKIVKTVNNPVLSRLIYKTSSIILLVQLLRNMFFTNFRMNNSVDGLLGYIQDFNNSSKGKVKSGINMQSKMIAVDIENASDNAEFDLKDQDKEIIEKAKEVNKSEISNEPSDGSWSADF